MGALRSRQGLLAGDDVSASEIRTALAAMKSRFLEVAKDNKVFPIGAGNWLRLHPEDRIKTPYTSWHFDADTTRMPEFTAPGLGRESNHRHHRCGVRRECVRACSMRSAALPAG